MKEKKILKGRNYKLGIIEDENKYSMRSLVNLVKRNKKYEDVYNLINLKNNRENNRNILTDLRCFSERKINNTGNVNKTKINESHLVKIKKLYKEIESFNNNNNNMNILKGNNMKKKVNKSKKNIFDSLNIITHFDRPLNSNRSNINMLRQEKNKNLIESKKTSISQLNILKDYNIPSRKKKFDENDIKKWINHEKYGTGNINNFYDEQKLNISYLMSFNNNIETSNLKRNFSSNKNKLNHNLNGNYFENKNINSYKIKENKI